MRIRLPAVLAAVLWCAVPALAQDKVRVVATFSILDDLARNVGGDRIASAPLVGPNMDAHVYSPSPSDTKALQAAKVVISNGLGFEGWIDRLVRASGAKARLVVASTGIKPRSAGGGHGHGHSHDADPHAWQSVANAKIYVANIRDGLTAADPDGKASYQANVEAYLRKLDALEAEIKASLARIPAERRRIITNHDAFGYFSAAYGVTFIAPQGVSTEADVSARDVARLIAQIRKDKITALFLENVTEPRMLQRIAQETGARIGGMLYSDALTDAKGAAPTYIDMMRHNVGQLTQALTN
jgi:zinc/manganese transport system substrate-binding protein